MTYLKLHAIPERHDLLCTGHVIRIEGELHVVRTASGQGRLIEAVPAASCLLMPEVGDQVLLAGDPSDACFVLAVLVRTGARLQRLQLDGDASLCARGGKLTLIGEQGVDIQSPAALSLTGQELAVTAAAAHCTVGRMDWIGQRVDVMVKKLHLIGDKLEALVDTVFQRGRVSLRRFDEVERVEAGQLDYQADALMVLRAQTAIVNGQDLVKADGGQIHLG